MTQPTESEVTSHGMTHGLTFGEARRDLMQGRCGTCRWWVRDVHGEPTMECERARVESGKYDGGMFVPNGEPLYTRADFGCVLWEPHDTEGTA